MITKVLHKLNDNTLKALMEYYAKKRVPFQDMLNSLSKDYDISHIQGKVKNRYQFNYSIMQEYNHAKRNRYASYWIHYLNEVNHVYY